MLPPLGTVRTVLKKLGRVADPKLLTELRLNGAVGISKGEPPEVGGTFDMLAATPNPDADARYVGTSQIQKVEQLGPDKYRFETFNSVYEVEFFREG